MKIQLIILIAIIALAGCATEQLAGQGNGVQNGNIVATIRVFDTQNQLALSEQFTTTPQTTVFEMLGQNNIQIEYDSTAYGPFLKTIAGVEPGEGEYIAIYVDSEYAQEGIGTLRLQNGQQIEFRIEQIDLGANTNPEPT